MCAWESKDELASLQFSVLNDERTAYKNKSLFEPAEKSQRNVRMTIVK
jgi:hypothetical protein